MDEKYAALRLEKQFCFPLYACARQAIKQCKPFLDEMDLTYTQYIVMTVLWEKRSTSVKDLGQVLYLDSGTLTPLLKKMEARGLLTRRRSADDERSLIVSLTRAGEELRERALASPMRNSLCFKLEPEEMQELNRLLDKLMK